MIEIKDIKLNEDGYYDTTFFNISANSDIDDLGRTVFGVSFDSVYAFRAAIIDPFENIENDNPPIRVYDIFRRCEND